MSTLVRLVLLALCLVSSAAPAAAADPAPSGQVTWAVHFTLAPRWLDPGENEGSITPYLTLYAVHDALFKPMPSLLHDRTVLAPIWENGFIRGVGPRVEESALALIPFHSYSAPYEDVRLKP